MARNRCAARWVLRILTIATVVTAAGMADRARAACEVFTTSGSTYPPVVYREGDGYTGAAVDVLRTALRRVGVRLETTYVGPFKRVLMQARHGKLDGLPGLYRLAEREQYYRYVAPIGPDPVAVFVREGSGIRFTRLRDLKGHHGATRLGDSFGSDFDRYAEAHLDISRHGDVGKIMRMLAAGRVDYAVFGYYAGRKAARDAGVGDAVAARTNAWVTNQPLWLVISEQSPCTAIADALAAELDALRDNGAFQEAVERHMDKLGDAGG